MNYDTYVPQTMDRRTFLVGAGVGCVLGSAGCLWQSGDGPGDVGEEFIQQLDNGNFDDANDLIHSDSTLDGAGQAADLLAGLYRVDSVIEAIDFSVQDSQVVDKSDGEATVEVTVTVDLLVDEVEDDIPLEMRRDENGWRVWLLLI